MRPLLGLLLLVLVAGCGGDDGEGADPASLEGVQWVLASGVVVPLDLEVELPTATFADGTVGGTTGCNSYTAPYTLDGDSLEIGLIASTLRACPPPADRIEREYLAALERVAAWEVADDELALHDADHAEVLRYTAGASAGG